MNRSSLLNVATMAFLAAAAVCVAAMIGDLRLPIYPLLTLLCLLVLCALCPLWLWSAGDASRMIIFAASVALIDLGFPSRLMTIAVKALIYGVLLASSALALSGHRDRSDDRGPAGAFLIYALGSWATIIYSRDPATTAYTGFALFSLALGGWWLAGRRHAEVLWTARVARDILGGLLLLSLVAYVAAPGLVIARGVAGEGRLAGLFGAPNALGTAAAVGMLITLSRTGIASPSRIELARTILWLPVFLASLLLSGSRTAAAGLLIGLMSQLLIRWPLRATSLLCLGGLAALAASVAGDGLTRAILSAVARSRDARDVFNLTGRLPLWEHAYGAWLQNPWLGYGLGSSRRLLAETYVTRWGQTFESAHNALLESLLNVGLVGTGLLLLVLIWLGLRLSKAVLQHERVARPGAALATGLASYAIAQGITEKSFAGTPSTATGALILAIAIACTLPGRKETGR